MSYEQEAEARRKHIENLLELCGELIEEAHLINDAVEGFLGTSPTISEVIMGYISECLDKINTHLYAPVLNETEAIEQREEVFV